MYVTSLCVPISVKIKHKSVLPTILVLLSNQILFINGDQNRNSTNTKVLEMNRKQREVQLTSDLDEHTSYSTFSITTEEKILYAVLCLGVLLIITCCCVCWRYCFCDSSQTRTIIYQQMPASRLGFFRNQVRMQPIPLVTTVDTSDIANLIQMPTASYAGNEDARNADNSGNNTCHSKY